MNDDGFSFDSDGFLGLGTDVSDDDKDDDDEVTTDVAPVAIFTSVTVGVGVTEALMGEKRTVGSPKGGSIGEPDCFA